ncbi:MAG: exodeoxyribonuclease V subunit gamma [Desulfamplus sp.]|nr:exodeoxyribonuclease V subunit gamma [Desulfamplus sp.]
MAGIKLYRSNGIEELADALADNIKHPLSSPLAPEIILVQSLGMAKWLNLEMANRLGVWANSSFVFPNPFINRLFSIVLPNVDEKLFLEREMMTWIIFDYLINLDQINFNNIFAHLATYCNGEDREFRAFQLARQLAMTYDQYLLYRPDFIYLWESQKIREHKPLNDWQAALWREICKRKDGVTHKAARRKEFMEALENYRQIGRLPERLPERVSVFGISSLPIFHLDILASLSELIEIAFYVMTPAKGYFSDLKSAKAKMKHENFGNYMGISPDLLHIDTGNPLLSSLGRAGADFMENLLNFDNLEDIDLKFIEPSGKTILSMVQQDILLMQDRGNILSDSKLSEAESEGRGDIAKTVISIDEIGKDRSIVINSCHSPMREVEVLNDYLLELFDSASGKINSEDKITPADVLVMTPDIESYAPFIRAVFTTPEEERLKIPFSIADLSIKSVSRSVDVFMQILSLPQSRFEVPFIMDILECSDVARCFGLEPRDVDLVRDWIKESAIRWGIDGKYKESLGLPCFEENSWRAGLDRLMAGYAMTGRGEQFFKKDDFLNINILPCDCVEGNSSKVLGSLSRFFNTLSKTAKKMAEKMTLSEWSDFLMSVLDDFFLPDVENNSMVQQIRDTLSELKNMEAITEFNSKIESKVIKSWCDKAIGKEYRDSNFLNGGVTFCAMLPMRSIPAKVICIIGLNDGIFPRVETPPNFDLIKQSPRRGDRSLRNEDRYLFLETIISARERLYLSYTGQGIEDNSVIPPSVVVSELMDYLDQSFVVVSNSCDSNTNSCNSNLVSFSSKLNSSSSSFSSDAASSFSSDSNCFSSKPLSSYILTRHRLQPFSPTYFEKKTHFSYSKANFLAASALLKKKEPIKPFISEQIVGKFQQNINEEDDSPSIKGGDSGCYIGESVDYGDGKFVCDSSGYGYDIISLNNLLKFFSSPQKYFLENSLGIYLKEQGEKLDDCEPFSLDYLETYKLKDEMLNRIIKKREDKLAQNSEKESTQKNSSIIDIYKAKGVLPHGTPGLAFYEENQILVRSFYRKIAQYIESGSSDSLEVDIIYNGSSDQIIGSRWRLKGTVSDVWGDKIVRFRVASVKPKDILRAWITHLACSCHHQSSLTFVIGKDKIYQFKTPDSPISLLNSLITIYKQGITKPIQFFPESSKAYADAYKDAIFKKKLDSYSAMRIGIGKAKAAFQGSFNKSGEGESEDIKLCFREIEIPLDDEFCSLSNCVWIPILDHLETLNNNLPISKGEI